MSESKTQNPQDIERVHDAVREGYARIAKSERGSCCGPSASSGPSSCCGADAPATAFQLAETVGYDAEALAQLPEGANMGLSCGNPVALASLEEGETVVDLGSGGGFDVFLAGPRVGATGRAIGVDMTPEMLQKARRNTASYRETSGLDNVEFRLGEIEHLPLADASADCVISNCVINLSPRKEQVWREIARVLKPGGRVAVSDLALLRPLPPEVASRVEALVGCVAGAVLVDETVRMAREAGLVDIEARTKDDYVRTMTDAKDELWQEVISALPEGASLADYVTSLDLSARQAGASGYRTRITAADGTGG
jgi:SAM-dependent methyltransferase